jgi:uncharacterized protein HemX
MAIDDVPVQSGQTVEVKPSSGGGAKTILVVIALAALAAGELFTVGRMNTVRDQLATQQGQLREDMTGQMRDQLSSRLSVIQRQNSEELDAIRTELEEWGIEEGAQTRGDTSRPAAGADGATEAGARPEGRPATSWRSHSGCFHDEIGS